LVCETTQIQTGVRWSQETARSCHLTHLSSGGLKILWSVIRLPLIYEQNLFTTLYGTGRLQQQSYYSHQPFGSIELTHSGREWLAIATSDGNQNSWYSPGNMAKIKNIETQKSIYLVLPGRWRLQVAKWSSRLCMQSSRRTISQASTQLCVFCVTTPALRTLKHCMLKAGKETSIDEKCSCQPNSPQMSLAFPTSQFLYQYPKKLCSMRQNRDWNVVRLLGPIRETYLFGKTRFRKGDSDVYFIATVYFRSSIGKWRSARFGFRYWKLSDSTVTRSAGCIEITTTGIRINLSDLHDL